MRCTSRLLRATPPRQRLLGRRSLSSQSTLPGRPCAAFPQTRHVYDTLTLSTRSRAAHGAVIRRRSSPARRARAQATETSGLRPVPSAAACRSARRLPSSRRREAEEAEEEEEVVEVLASGRCGRGWRSSRRRWRRCRRRRRAGGSTSSRPAQAPGSSPEAPLAGRAATLCSRATRWSTTSVGGPRDGTRGRGVSPRLRV